MVKDEKPDREKVIQGLEHCGPHMECDGCPYDATMGNCFMRLKSDAKELLKEQSELVHCKDCKHSTNYSAIYDERQYRCVIHYWFRDANYFCAEGERR